MDYAVAESDRGTRIRVVCPIDVADNSPDSINSPEI